MTRNDKIAALILGAAATVAVIRYLNMPADKRKEFTDHIKARTNELLDHADNTVDRVKGFLSEYDEQPKSAWIEKLYVLKKMFKSLYTTDKKFFL